MSDDNVVEFPERREVIPVNDPDIGCAMPAQCGKCGLRVWTVMLWPGSIVPCEYRCANKQCDNRVELSITEPA